MPVRAEWLAAIALSLGLHMAVSQFYVAGAPPAVVERRAGEVAIVSGGLVNSAGSEQAEAVSAEAIAARPVETAVAETPAPREPAAAEAPVADVAADLAVTGVPVVAAAPAEAPTPDTLAPVAPPAQKPVAEPEKPKEKPRREHARAPARSDTVGGEVRGQRQNRQAGSGGRSRTADGRAAESSYASRVMSRLASRKRYPAAARRSRAQGTVTVRFTLNRSGRVVSVRVVRSSGNRALDNAAVSLVRRAAPFPRFPAAITRSRLTYTAPLSYRLR